MILPLLPTIAQDQFGASNFIIGILIASNALFALMFAPIWGKLSDLYGRKPLLIISQLGTLMSFLLLGFSNSLEMIFLSRILDGVWDFVVYFVWIFEISELPLFMISS